MFRKNIESLVCQQFQILCKLQFKYFCLIYNWFTLILDYTQMSNCECWFLKQITMIIKTSTSKFIYRPIKKCSSLHKWWNFYCTDLFLENKSLNKKFKNLANDSIYSPFCWFHGTLWNISSVFSDCWSFLKSFL